MVNIVFKEALIVAFIAGGWELITIAISMIPVLSQKDNIFISWIIIILRGLSSAMNYSPLIVATLTGFALGDVKTGLLIGSTVQLMFIGVFIVGASLPPNPHVASILATAFAILGGLNQGEAIAIVLPIAVLSQMISMLVMTINTFLCHWADGMAEDGNTRGIDILNTINTFGWAIGEVIAGFLGIYFGVELVQKIVDVIPEYISSGLGLAAGMLPALGFGMLLLIISSKKTWPFFFIGFLIATYTDMNAVAIAILGMCIALIYDQITHSKGFIDEETSV